MISKFPITSAQDALDYGRIITKSGLFGRDVNCDEKGAVIALMCHGENMGLLEFRRTWHIMDNSPTMKADVMLAKFLELGGNYKVLERTATKASISLWRADCEPRTFTVTIDDVKKAGYCFKRDGVTLKDNWAKIPTQMLWARVVSDAVRVIDPRVNAGIYTQEEVADFNKSENETVPPQAVERPKAAKSHQEQTQGNAVANTKPQQAAGEATQGNPNDPFSGPEDIDYTIVPFGPHQGKRWKDLTQETLQKVLKNPKTLSPQHLEAVKVALEDDIPF